MQLTLPNGKLITVDDNTTEEEKKKILETLSNSEEYQKIDTQSFEDSQEKDTEGLIGDWRPEGAATSWVFDNAVIAPYEGTRKFVNSTMSLAEGLGDTLGEKTNLGGFRYGKDAENGMMEYVPYDQAIKLGNVKGILSPITGNIGQRDYSHIKGFFYDPDKANPEDNTESLTASFVEGGLQFILGWITGGKILKGLKIGTHLTTAGQISKSTVQGGIADFIGFDELSGRLTDMIIDHYPDTADTWLGYLASDPDDEWWEARMKNTLEGGGIGAFAEVLMAGLRLTKGYISKNARQGIIKHDEKVISKAQEKLTEIKPLLDEAATLSEKMAIMNKELENVLPKKPKLKLTTAEKTAFFRKITKDDQLKNWDRYKKGELTIGEAITLPRNAFNLDTFAKSEITQPFVKTVKELSEVLYKNYDSMPKEYTDEIIQHKAIQDYGGDTVKVYNDFKTLAKNTKNVSALITAHEQLLHSMIKALPSTYRNAQSGIKGYTKQGTDEMLALVLAMTKNRGKFGHHMGGNFRTLGITKKALTDDKVIKEQLDSALKEFNEFSQGVDNRKAKEKLMQKLTTLDRPSSARLILNFVSQNRTWEVLNELWINALLSSPKTQLVNTIGNAITALAKPIEDKMGANISRYLSEGDIGRVTKYNQLSIEAGSTFAGLFQYLGDSVRMGTRAWRQGELILEGSAGLSKIDTGTKTIGKIGKFDVGKWVRMPSRALNAGDEVFKQANYRAKLRAIGVREAYRLEIKGKEFDKFVKEHFENGFDEFGRGLDEEALTYAREATYTNELTGFTKKFQQAVNEYPFLKQIFPFIRTPFQLAKSIVDRSPAAVTYRWRHLLGESNNAKEIVKARGQFAMGTILFSSAYALAKLGMIQSKTNLVGEDARMLSSFKDSKLLRLKKSKLNFKPYSFVVKGVQIPFGRLDPYGAFFGLVADIMTNYDRLTQDEIEKQGAAGILFLMNRMDDSPLSFMDKASIAGKATFNATRDNLLSKSYLHTVHEIIDGLFNEDAQSFSRYWNNKITSYYPNIFNKIVNDPYLRDANTFWEHFKKRSGLGKPVEPKFNFLGEEHRNPEGNLERLFNNMLSPITASKLLDDEVIQEILRIGKAPAVLDKFQNNVDYTEYEYKGKSAYYRLNHHLKTVKIYDDVSGKYVTFYEKLKLDFKTDGYLSKSDPLKIAQTIQNVGGKYEHIQELYQLYFTQAKQEMRKEWSLFKHVDNDKQSLATDIPIKETNKKAVTQENRTENSLKEKLRIIEQQ